MTVTYRKNLIAGLHYQDLVVERLYEIGIPIISYSSKEFQNIHGENRAGIEIKFDRKFRETGNLYFEIAEKSRPENKDYIPSGIYRMDNSWLYVIGDETEFFIFSKKQLKLLHQSKKYLPKQTPTSMGFIMPVEDARKFYSIHTVKFLDV